MVILDERWLRCLVYGGAVLGAGGGGSIEAGLAAGRRALARGSPCLAKLDELGRRAKVVTLSGVGTVSGDKEFGVDHLDQQRTRAFCIFSKTFRDRVAGLIPSEVGALAVTYGWSESACLGIPVVDAPCNGRAHPLGLMGSLGLHRMPRYITTSVAVGGRPGTERYIDLRIRSSAAHASGIIRRTVASSGISLGVVRNPLPAAYVARHAAVGGLDYARRVGEVFLKHRLAGSAALLGALGRLMGGDILGTGRVVTASLRDRKGFTLGSIVVEAADGALLQVPVCNEYMQVKRGGRLRAAFPDLIAIFDQSTALPLGSAQVRPGQSVAIFGVPRAHLKLASTMRDAKLLRSIEALLGIRFPRVAAHPSEEKVPFALADGVRT